MALSIYLGGLVRTSLHAPRLRRRSITAATLGALALIGSLLVAVPAHALNDTGTGGVFVPAAGTILDTKNNIGGFSTPMPAKAWRTVKVTGIAGIPDDGTVGAVSLVATAASIPAQGQLFGRPDANTSQTLMGIYGGENNANTSFSSVLAVSADGTIQVNAETSVRLILGVQGYYTANTDGTAPGGFVPSNGKRVADSRFGTGIPKAQLTSGKSATLQVTGTAGIPAGASAVIVNLIALNSTSSVGYLTPYATGATRPVNAFNYAGDVITTMQAQVPLSADGKITIYNANSTIDLALDVQGYFTAAGNGGAMFTPGQGRIVDTRTTGGNFAGDETRAYDIAGKAGVPVMGSGVNAVVLTLTSIATNSAGWGRIWANGDAEPDTASLRYENGTVRSNTITVPLGANGKINLHNIGAGATNFAIDVQGWYSVVAPAAINCGSVAVGAWLRSVPVGGLDCTITANPADHANELVSYTLDDSEPVGIALSDTQATVVSLHVPATAGRHVLSVDEDQGDETVSSAVWYANFGDWTAAAVASEPDNSERVSLKPQLAVWTEDVALPNEATYIYRIWDQPDTNRSPIVTSDPQTGGWSVPAGLLANGATYYWSAQVDATLAGQPGRITTPSASFITDASVSDSPGAPDDAAAYSLQDVEASTASDTPSAIQFAAPSDSTATVQPDGSGSVPGPSGIGLRCGKHYHYATFNATFDMQRACYTTKMAWGFQVSVAFCSGAYTSATESGMQIWDHTNRTSNRNAGHRKHCTYFFHGTMSGIIAGHQISYYDSIVFRAYKFGRPGTGWVDTNGIFTVTNRTR